MPSHVFLGAEPAPRLATCLTGTEGDPPRELSCVGFEGSGTYSKTGETSHNLKKKMSHNLRRSKKEPYQLLVFGQDAQQTTSLRTKINLNDAALIREAQYLIQCKFCAWKRPYRFCKSPDIPHAQAIVRKSSEVDRVERIKLNALYRLLMGDDGVWMRKRS